MGINNKIEKRSTNPSPKNKNMNKQIYIDKKYPVVCECKTEGVSYVCQKSYTQLSSALPRSVSCQLKMLCCF